MLLRCKVHLNRLTLQSRAWSARWAPEQESHAEVPDEAMGLGFHEAARRALSHHLVIRDRKIAIYTRPTWIHQIA